MKGALSMVPKELYDKEIKTLIEFARKNNHSITYTTVANALKDHTESVNVDALEMAISFLLNAGIKINPSDGDEDYPAKQTDPDIFVPAEVNIKQMPLKVYNLLELLESNKINLETALQFRNKRWSLETQSQLIESLLLKITLPAFYFVASENNNWVVIDGLQRLFTFQNFLLGTGTQHEKKRFEGLQYFKHFNGLTFDELPKQYIRRIKETTLIAFSLEKGMPEEIVFNIFQRINTGSKPQNDQEIRQMLCRGKATALIKELAESGEFFDATRGLLATVHMLDQEYVTRFLAFTEVDYRKEYDGNINSFLIKGLKRINRYDDEHLFRIKNNFKRVMLYCTRIFGKYAFRRYNKDWRRGPINKAIFEIWAICFTKLTDDQLEMLVTLNELVLEKFQALLQSVEFARALKSGDRYSLMRRIELTEKLVQEILEVSNTCL